MTSTVKSRGPIFLYCVAAPTLSSLVPSPRAIGMNKWGVCACPLVL
jgi:hypothetical protein